MTKPPIETQTMTRTRIKEMREEDRQRLADAILETAPEIRRAVELLESRSNGSLTVTSQLRAEQGAPYVSLKIEPTDPAKLRRYQDNPIWLAIMPGIPSSAPPTVQFALPSCRTTVADYSASDADRIGQWLLTWASASDQGYVTRPGQQGQTRAKLEADPS